MLKFLFFSFVLSTSSVFFGQEQTRILFILDASNSMNTEWDKKTRIELAKEHLNNSIEGLRGVPNLEIALRVYGHQSPITATYQDCNDTKLEVGFAANNIDKIKQRIRGIEAKGTTPIARSLEAAAADFPDTLARNFIILITDGIEACDNDPCLIAKKLKDKGVKVTPFVIGLGMDLSYLEKFKCIGSYFDSESSESFNSTLQTVIKKTLINTTVQIDLNDIYKKPTETNVTMFLYEAGTKNLKYTFIHTINRYGNPDTLVISPDFKYDLIVNTIPLVTVNNIAIQKHTHNTIKVDCPQGFIKVQCPSCSNGLNDITVRVMQQNVSTTLNVQNLNSTVKYITGNYDIEVLTLPRTTQKVDVQQSKTELITIKAPGTFNYTFASEYIAQVFLVKSDGAVEWVLNIDDKSKKGQWQLQPGSYKLVYRLKNQKSSTYTGEKTFKIDSNRTTTFNL
ncbi:MAG: VWA domain-containing protein [Bacteroidetes bacterium]|nr:VWA domain-containing protein [Bacteroidota bacterium]